MGKKVNKKQLKQLRYLKQEIKMLQRQIDDMDYTIATDSVRGSDREYPYTQRSFTISGIDYEDYNRRIRRLQRQLNRRVEELVDLVEETYKYIDNIDDSLIRQIISLRYINGLTWDQVAATIGGGNTADSVRMMHDRFLKTS